MNPWLATIGVFFLAGVGVVLGRWLSRLPKPWWVVGYVVPLVFLLTIAASRWIPHLEFIPPISWLMAGRTEFALLPLFVGVILLTRLPHLRGKRTPLLMGILIVAVTLYSAALFLAPIFIRGRLANLKTQIGHDGICLQGSGYTCVPSSAVTVLRKLQLPAEEGELAVLAHTCPNGGTMLDILGEVLREKYGKDGLVCEYRRFDSIAELKHDGYTLAAMKHGFWVDHCVAVLEITDKEVIVGDPLIGKVGFSHERFAQKWRFTGLVIRREKR